MNLLTVSEVATALRVNPRTVYRLITNGELPARRIGRNWRIFETEFHKYLDNTLANTESNQQ